MTFFTTILSIDIRRLELSDLHDHRLANSIRSLSSELSSMPESSALSLLSTVI